MNFGATLQLLRSHAGLTLRGLGDQVGVSAAYLSRLEHGHDPAPTRERARALADALGVPGALLLGLIDELRDDATDWLRATPTGRRLAAELRRRALDEAQLARVLAFVQREFPAGPGRPAGGVAALLDPTRVLLRVRAARLDDVWTLAALRLAEGPRAEDLVEHLRRPGSTTCLGEGTAVAFVRGHLPGPRVGLIVCEVPIDVATPDDVPVRLVWVLAGVPAGPGGAELLTAVARLADADLARALLASRTPGEALGWVARFEAPG